MIRLLCLKDDECAMTEVTLEEYKGEHAFTLSLRSICIELPDDPMYGIDTVLYGLKIGMPSWFRHRNIYDLLWVHNA